MRNSIHTAITAVLYIAAAWTLALPTAVSANDTRWPGETLDGLNCTEFAWDHGYGPFNYTNPRHRNEKLKVVEDNHFTETVRTLRRGENAQSPLNDLEYTIGAFPNHHQALYSMIRYATEEAYSTESRQVWESSTRGGRPRPPPECYLQRAVSFAPDDHRARLLYGLFLHRKGALEQSLAAYREALRLKPDSAETHYNLGLLLLETDNHEEAARHARKAYERGYPLSGLRQRLAEHGYHLDQ